ncbi:MAG: ISAs1 family transposase [Caulobacteraceae bacterium]
MSWISKCFEDVPDPRTGNAVRHDLLEVLTIALTAAICGAETCVDFADFAADRELLFRSFLVLDNGLPSHDTFSRLFRLIDPAAFSMCFGRFLEALGGRGEGVLAIDGKTLRRSFDRAAGASPLHVVSAFACERRLVIGQAAVGEGANEITAARDLLRLLDLTGMLVTGDAIHCQSQTAELITQRGGQWLFALKANRPAMHEAAQAFFADPGRPLVEHVTTDADHGRLEVRTHRVVHDVDWLFSDRRYAGEPALPGLASLAMVQAQVTTPDGHTTTSSRLYVSSAKLDPRTFAQAVRAHWRIENSLHWVLDTAFDEDRARSRKDHGPENLAILRKLALNVLQSSRKDISIRRKRKRSGWSDEFARSILGQMR